MQTPTPRPLMAGDILQIQGRPDEFKTVTVIKATASFAHLSDGKKVKQGVLDRLGRYFEFVPQSNSMFVLTRCYVPLSHEEFASKIAEIKEKKVLILEKIKNEATPSQINKLYAMLFSVEV